MSTAQVHRFGDCVAAYLGDGQTVYMTPGDAKRLAVALNKCARDCIANKFTDSKFTTFELPLSATGHNGTDFRIHRGPVMRAYDVFRPGNDKRLTLIDTVFFTGYTVDDVRQSLINHDGYSHDIVVKLARTRGKKGE